ncbi:MAG: BON domain-containing protein [Desulfobacula sp.]|nr:BON domain-containing protein [Desulfobacula sp.]
MQKRLYLIPIVFMITLTLSGCGAAVIGGAGYTGYKGSTDERSAGTILDDMTIFTTIKTKMIGDEFVKARNIDVDVLNGVVYLIGVVESASQKRMAVDIARGVEGVRRVEDQLVIGKTSAGQILNDTILTSKIRTALLKDPDIRSFNIDVDTNNNTVTLTGMVSSYTEKDKVLYIVQNVVGKRQVIDNLSVGN